MWVLFEQLCLTQEIHGAQLAEIVESTHRYANELVHQRASIDRQEVMQSQLCIDCYAIRAEAEVAVWILVRNEGVSSFLFSILVVLSSFSLFVFLL